MNFNRREISQNWFLASLPTRPLPGYWVPSLELTRSRLGIHVVVDIPDSWGRSSAAHKDSERASSSSSDTGRGGSEPGEPGYPSYNPLTFSQTIVRLSRRFLFPLYPGSLGATFYLHCNAVGHRVVSWCHVSNQKIACLGIVAKLQR